VITARHRCPALHPQRAGGFAVAAVVGQREQLSADPETPEPQVSRFCNSHYNDGLAMDFE
jgi:hypothetical protein